MIKTTGNKLSRRLELQMGTVDVCEDLYRTVIVGKKTIHKL